MYYDEISQGYDELHFEEQFKKLELIKKHLKVKKTDKLLDVGCGSGISSNFECFVVGIDPSVELLKIGEGNRIHGQGEKLPFKDNSFDIVTSVTAIQNFCNVSVGLDEIRRVGKNKFVVTVLKKSTKIERIKELIISKFKVKKMIIEDKDIIFFLE